VTIYDPEQDPDGFQAKRIIEFMTTVHASMLGALGSAREPY
jgi:hypothetical protein